MKLDQLQYFVETARREHLGQAANFLNVSPSAISHSIAQLEDQLGKKLFEKTGRRIRLTETGHTLLGKAEAILADILRIQNELSDSSCEIKGHFRLSATHLLCSQLLTPVYLKIQKKYNQVTSRIQSFRSGEVLTKVDSGELDLGVCFSPHSSPLHEQEDIFQGKLLLAFGKQHLFLKSKNINHLQHYQAAVALGAQGIENCESNPIFKKFSLNPKVGMYFDTYDVAVEALKSQNFWALLPDFLCYKHQNFIETYTPKNWSLEYRITAIWPRHKIRTPFLDLMISGMKEELNQKFKA
ncbi:MAG: LysR family transcriptional regulator [Bdellovibrionaceae bacterium]|nr:LysR family transcriptional regulator [Pseudobdellovibrionaceae bacterium]NUM57218.1 LysR family transcriptional regulator [Pseudobdellovibrionaceae bacterium]